MKKILLGVLCLGVLRIVSMPIDAQEPSHLNEPVNEMTFKSDKLKNYEFEKGDDHIVIEESYTYRLTGLDNRLTAKAIAREEIKLAFLEEIVAFIGKQAKEEKNRAPRSSDKGARATYESIAAGQGLRALLPSIVYIEDTDESLGDKTLVLKAKAAVSPTKIASAASVIREKQRVLDEIVEMRSLASAAMETIRQMQKDRAGAGEPAGQDQSYLNAANQLMAVDRYERARYHELNGGLSEAVDAYTEAIDILPNLAVAYMNRGRLYLRQFEDKSKAAADFNSALQAYIVNAAIHMKSREFAECVDDIDAALKLSEKYAEGYFQRAACLTGLHDQAGAREDFVRSAQLGNKAAQDLLSAREISW